MQPSTFQKVQDYRLNFKPETATISVKGALYSFAYNHRENTTSVTKYANFADNEEMLVTELEALP